MKSKNIQIKIEEKSLDYKNSILFSFSDFSEILDNLNFKKGTLFYEYIINCLEKIDNNSIDSIFFIYADIIKSIISESALDIDYDIDEDLEKLILNFSTFKLNTNINQISYIINKILTSYIEKNINKLVIIFYDSDILTINLNIYDNVYLFDISNHKNISEYNLLCINDITYFDINIILEKLESLWPVEFNKEKVLTYINDFYLDAKNHSIYNAYNETEYLVYYLLNKFYNLSYKINCNCKLRDNVISFITKF